MKKQGKSAGSPRPNNVMKKSPGPNKNNLKDKNANKSPLKFLNDMKKSEKNVKPLVEKILGQGKVVKNPGNSPNKNKGKKGGEIVKNRKKFIKNNKNKNMNKSKKGMAPPVNPDKDNAVTEESEDEEMEEVNKSEDLETQASSPKKSNKKKLGLLAAKTENKENGDEDQNEENEKDDENVTSNTEKEGKGKRPKKFCLFVGNLPFDVTEEQVREHFKSVKDGLKAVRLMSDKKSGKGKGFGFIELLNSGAYTAAMKLHKRKMGERVIRVEYTTPGKSDNKSRKKFINNKTKKLLGQKKNKKGKGFNKKKGKK
ncbi:unnamed protein product [Meganyctiphanes norvegica]|uniref:RRM domain-containing protein n=1 Tax=Meganyctiphanes norvegica TaxID=48144 RepID=A0AAV2PJ58_MEGNR